MSESHFRDLHGSALSVYCNTMLGRTSKTGRRHSFALQLSLRLDDENLLMRSGEADGRRTMGIFARAANTDGASAVYCMTAAFRPHVKDPCGCSLCSCSDQASSRASSHAPVGRLCKYTLLSLSLSLTHARTRSHTHVIVIFNAVSSPPRKRPHNFTIYY